MVQDVTGQPANLDDSWFERQEDVLRNIYIYIKIINVKERAKSCS